MTTATKTKPKKPTEAERFDYEGETLAVTGPAVYEMLAEYRASAQALHDAKERAFAAEERIKEYMGGYEALVVDGEQKVAWKWKLKTAFDKRQLQRDDAALVEKYTTRTPDGIREFSAKGVVGVS